MTSGSRLKGIQEGRLGSRNFRAQVESLLCLEGNAHLAILHLGQAILPCLFIEQADPHHAVHVVGVSRHRKRNGNKRSSPFAKGSCLLWQNVSTAHLWSLFTAGAGNSLLRVLGTPR